ncbi:MAG: KR domain-containing protein [Desulfobacterales bacterium]|nr:KR domain-containing protein [Desulfobacterales bacterium]
MFLDGLANYRKTQGLPATSINWGLWEKAGMIETLQFDLSLHGAIPIKQENGLLALERILADPVTQISVISCDWNKLAEKISNRKRKLFSNIIDKMVAIKNKENQEIEFVDKAKRASHDERKKMILEFLSKTVSELIGIPNLTDYDLEEPLNLLGIDSLVASVIRRRIKDNLDVEIPIVKLFEDINIKGLADIIGESLISDEETVITGEI